MKKKIIKLLKIIFILAIVGLLIFGAVKLYLKLTPIEIEENWNFKLSIDHMTAPVHILTYYFYDDYVIRKTYTSGVLPSGPSSSTTLKKYKLSENIDISKLKELVKENACQTDEKFMFVRAEDKDGTKYEIPFGKFTSEGDGLLGFRVVKLYELINEITDKAYIVKEREVNNN